MKQSESSIWGREHIRLSEGVNREINPEVQPVGSRHLAELLGNIDTMNFGIQRHSEHVKKMSLLLEELDGNIDNMDYFREFLVEDRIESRGLRKVFDKVVFELFKRSNYDKNREKYLELHRNNLDIRNKIDRYLSTAPDHISHFDGDDETEVLSQSELCKTLWPHGLEGGEIVQGTGNCYYVAVLMTLHNKSDKIKDLISGMVTEERPGIFLVKYEGFNDPVEVSTLDILRYAAYFKLAKSTNIGDSILEVAYNEYHERADQVIHIKDATVGSRKVTSLEQTTEGGESRDVYEAFFGDKAIVDSEFIFFNKSDGLDFITAIDPENTLVCLGSLQEEQYISELKARQNDPGFTENEKKTLERLDLGIYPRVDIDGKEQFLKSNHEYAVVDINQQEKTMTLLDPDAKGKELSFGFSVIVNSFFTATTCVMKSDSV